MHHSESVTIDTNAKFEHSYQAKIQLLLMSPPISRGPAHATTDLTMAMTHELSHVTESFEVLPHLGALQSLFKPNLPWAEDHFLERIGGEPLNPSPSEAWWPFARQGNAEHKQDQQFSHTYPERFWPRMANGGPGNIWLSTRRVHGVPHVGIRFEYGDLGDAIQVLIDNPNTRQAYLPIWFPEDLTAARHGQRVPCSMGYHFIRDGRSGKLDCVYTMRSCDIVRFYRDDLYMAGRLTQFVATHAGLLPGKLVVHIDNLHCFPDDRPFLEAMLPKKEIPGRYAGYNWDALS